MPMPAANTVASAIVTALNVPAAGVAAATADWTAIISQLQSMITAATVTINPGAVATGVTPGGAAVPVTGTATIA